ncbi:MAG TPA: TlpA disulfide reductase family protein [Patescibacteria group bacterium]|nr:TlpA disulfide reductase family protein [Patescibacteria group bacterium]
MKAKLLALIVIIVACGAAATYDLWQTPANAPASDNALVASPHKIPAINFTTLEGKNYFLSTLPEKGIILHFWASWCAPCALEFPLLLRKVAEANGNLALVSVSIDDSRPNMDEFLVRLKARGVRTDAPHVYWVWDRDKSISLKNFQTVRAPESVLINRQRRMIDKIAGDPGWAGQEMSRKLLALVR